MPEEEEEEQEQEFTFMFRSKIVTSMHNARHY
jgi:hypothetical protein